MRSLCPRRCPCCRSWHQPCYLSLLGRVCAGWSAATSRPSRGRGVSVLLILRPCMQCSISRKSYRRTPSWILLIFRALRLGSRLLNLWRQMYGHNLRLFRMSRLTLSLRVFAFSSPMCLNLGRCHGRHRRVSLTWAFRKGRGRRPRRSSSPGGAGSSGAGSA